MLILVSAVAPYVPGNFYLRELPCLLAVLPRLPAVPACIVVDGYVWVSAQGKPGLGARLHAALSHAAPVVGVAKTAFKPLHGSPLVELVYRGGSARPLFVTSLGIDVARAGVLVRSMHGRYRIPDALRRADHLARETEGAA